MNILILNWRDIKNPKAGGAEVVTHEYAKRWASQGHRITLFTAGYACAPEQEILDGVEIIRRGGPYTVHLLACWSYLTKLKNCYDVIIDQVHGIPFFTPLYIRDARIIVFIHEVAGEIWNYMYPFPLGNLGMMVEKFIFRYYRDVRFVTPATSTHVDLAKMGIRRSLMSAVPNGNSIQALAVPLPKEKIPTIIFVGRLCKMKGIEEALMAFSLVNESLPEAKLWIVGTGDNQYVQKLKQKTSELALCGQVTFFGFVSQTQKFDLMRRAHLLVHTSVKEGWGLVVIEANTQGTPTVGYRVPGLVDTVQDGQTGVLVPPHDTVTLANAILKVLKEENLRNTLSSNAVEWSKKFDWDESARQFWRIIEETLL
jgi:glycosyltransferase involved in cell wall biosynthesis